MSLPKNSDRGKSNHSEVEDRHQVTPHYAVLTGPGRSAIAVIGLRGSGSEAIVNRCFQRASDREWRDLEIRFGQWTGASTDVSARAGEEAQADSLPAEAVVVVRATTDDWEIQCHGGRAAIDRIAGDLRSCGARHADPAAWRRLEIDSINRPLQPASESFDDLIHEAAEVLQQCLTQRTAALALTQCRGAFRNWVVGSIERLQKADDAAPLVAQIHDEAREILRYAKFTVRLAEPLRVVLAGPPNVGKSSLMNAIVGYDRSIIFDQAGTTRDVLHAETVLEGLPIQLSDTAGLRVEGESIEQIGMRLARQAASTADVIVWISEPQNTNDNPPTLAEIDSLPLTPIRVLNKVDLIAADTHPHGYDVFTSTVTRTGISTLQQRIVQQIEPLIPPPGKPAVINERQQASLHHLLTQNHPTDLIESFQKGASC